MRVFLLNDLKILPWVVEGPSLSVSLPKDDICSQTQHFVLRHNHWQPEDQESIASNKHNFPCWSSEWSYDLPVMDAILAIA